MANTLKFKRGLLAGIPTAALGEPLFTTDTFDLYIGNGTGNTKFQKFIASGATTQIIRGDGSLYTFPLAISSPSSGQVLKYNGTSWVNDSDAGITGSGAAGQVAYFTGATTQGGSNNLFWNSANNRLGINTNVPSYTADIRSAAGTVLSLSGGSSTNQGAALYITNSAFTGTLTAFGDSANILGGTPDASATIFTNSSIPLHFYISGGQAARISTSRNFIINNASTDNGLRFQVTGDGYFSGSVGIGTSTLTGRSLSVSKNITGSTNAFVVYNDGQIQTDVSSSANYFQTSVSTAASTTIGQIRHFLATQAGFGAGTSVTNQIGFYANSSMVGATNNYGFYGDLASATGVWNLYLTGTAANFINGNLQLGSTTAFASAEKFQLTGDARIKTTSTGGLILEATSGTETPNLTFLSTTNRYNLDNSSGTLRFFRENTDGTSGAVRMSLTDDGNLGLGVTPSAWQSVYRSIDIGNASIFTAPANNEVLVFSSNAFLNSSGAWVYKGTGTANIFEIQSGGGFRWRLAPSGSAGGTPTFTQAMTLDASGNLGLGTTTLQNDTGYKTLSISGSTGGQVAFQTAGATRASIYHDNTNYHIINTQNGYIRLLTNNTERVHIFGDGNVGIATGNSNAGYKLDVNGTMRVSGVGSFVVNGAANQRVANFRNTGGNGYIEIQGSGSVAAQILSTALGDFYVATGGTAGTYGTTRLLIDNTGAATFSSSVTAGGNLLLTSGTASSIGAINLIRTGTSPVASRLTFGTDGTGYSFAIGKNQGGTVTDLVTILDSGAATFSSSVTLSGNLTVDTNTFFVDSSANRVGVKQSSPTSSLHVDGSNARSYVTKTANYTMTENDYTVLCDTTSGGFTITLPAASGCAGRIYCIKKTVGNSGVNNVTIDGNASETIDGSTTISLQCRSSVIIQSDGSNWWVLAEKNDSSCI